MKKKSTRRKSSRASESKNQGLLGSMAHSLGDAMAVAIGAAADTVTEFEKGPEPPKEARPKVKKSTKRTSAKPKRGKTQTAGKKKRSK